MRIAFRVDASLQIGAGHVMRCLSLADGLRDLGTECIFICRPHQGHLIKLIEQCGYRVLGLQPTLDTLYSHTERNSYADWLGVDWRLDALDTEKALSTINLDWLVVDHYAIDFRWENQMRQLCKRVMVIDDLANRAHDCDLLLDQNLGRAADDYSKLTSPGAIKLIGPKYALLRSEFFKLRPKSLSRRQSPVLKNLLVAMGGIDKDNITGTVLNVLKESSLPPDMTISVVMGRQSPYLSQVKFQAEQMKCPTHVMVDVSNMAELMATSDLAIGAAGGSAWERCCLGLPSIVIIAAENQRLGAITLEQEGAALIINELEDIEKKLMHYFEVSLVFDQLSSLSMSSAGLVDGNGVTRVIEAGILEGA